MLQGLKQKNSDLQLETRYEVNFKMNEGEFLTRFAEFLTQRGEQILSNLSVGKVIIWSFILFILFSLLMVISISWFFLKLDEKTIGKSHGLLFLLCGFASLEYGLLMCFSFFCPKGIIDTNIPDWIRDIYIVNLVPALMGIFFFALIFPKDLIGAIFFVVAPFIFPIIDLFIPGSHSLNLTGIILRSLLLMGYQVGFALLLFVATLIPGAFLVLSIMEKVFHINIHLIYCMVIGIILIGPIVVYVFLQVHLPILKIFFPQFSLNLVLWIGTTISILAQFIYNMSKSESLL